MLNIETTLKEIISEKTGAKLEDIKKNTHFVEDLGADSLEIVRIIMAIEDKFHIEIPDEDMEKIVTFQDAINYIEGRYKG